MKKAILLFSAVAIATVGHAQKKKIVEARDYFELKQFDKAIPPIEAAVTNDETKNNPDAWYLRGLIYEAAAILDAAQPTQNPKIADEAYKSFQKTLELKPDFSDEMMPNSLMATAQLSYNNGIKAYNDKDYKAAFTDFDHVNTLYKTNGGKLFAKDTAFKSMAIGAEQNAANAAVNDKNYAAALPIYEQLKNTPGAADTNTYSTLIYIYEDQKNSGAELATIHEAQAKYPDVVSFKNAEKNYYISTHDYASLSKYMEGMAQKDPNNPDANFQLTTIYEQLAFPEDKTKPAQFDEWTGKAESNIMTALKAKPDNTSYNYAAGLLYYSKARLINDDIDKLLGNRSTLPAADQKKYDALKASRNALFTQAIPYFEKTYTMDDARAATLESDEKGEYFNSMLALRDMYGAMNKKDKADLFTKKIDAASAAKK